MINDWLLYNQKDFRFALWPKNTQQRQEKPPFTAMRLL